VPDQSDIVSHGRRNTSLCSALLVKAGLKPSLATTTVKASERVIEGPLAWRTREGRGNDLFPALRKKRGNGLEFDYDDRKGFGACDRGRVIEDPLAWRTREGRGNDLFPAFGKSGVTV